MLILAAVGAAIERHTDRQVDTQIILDRWSISEPTEGTLRINPAPDFLVEIAVDSGTDTLQNLTVAKRHIGNIFEYQASGPCSTPAGGYGAGLFKRGEGVYWMDLNFDGWFDKRTVFSRNRMEVLVEDDAWLPGVKVDEFNVRTERGMFTYSPELGKWIQTQQPPATTPAEGAHPG